MRWQTAIADPEDDEDDNGEDEEEETDQLPPSDYNSLLPYTGK